MAGSKSVKIAQTYTFTLRNGTAVFQRLLWELEGNLAFTAPTVDQFRNAHRLIKDFLEEDALYKKAGSLVDALIAWRPSAGASLPTMMVELAQVCSTDQDRSYK